MSSRESLLDEMQWRGLLYQQTEGAEAHLSAGPVAGYCGFDPTADSLHVGNLVAIMGLVHLQRAGHRPVALVGGGTGMIGDPSGKTAERQLLTVEEIDANTASIRAQLERFLDFSGEYAARMVDNGEWLRELKAIEFMRDVGKHFTVNLMMQKDSVKSRLDIGISYTEFSYMLLQAYDFLELNRRYGVTLQVGGSVTPCASFCSVRRISSVPAVMLPHWSLPLVTTAGGSKFGKSEAGAVWLDASRTSPYQFYQFWVNADDDDAVKYLRMFTLLGRDEIDVLTAALAAAPHERAAQRRLAADVTARVHGATAAGLAEQVSRVIFDKRVNARELSVEVFETLAAELPHVLTRRTDSGVNIVEALEQAFALSRTAARKLIQQGAVHVNGHKLAAEAQTVDVVDAVHGRWFLLRKGGRDVAVVELA